MQPRFTLSAMITISTETTVGEIVRATPAHARVFERLGIDYCCGGKKSLANACRAKGLEPTTVVALLSALGCDGPANGAVDVDALSLSELCDHIEKTHHGYLREELPRLDFMTRKVAAVHGDHEPRLRDVRQVFEAFSAAMLSHTREEEQEVFPLIRRLESSSDVSGQATDLKARLDKLEVEHDQAGAALERFRELTDNFVPPEWACNTFRALYDTLAKLESETHQHVHKENNVLFPKALAAA
jgi:regulator of cell morphogenesis and NO signaling